MVTDWRVGMSVLWAVSEKPIKTPKKKKKKK